MSADIDPLLGVGVEVSGVGQADADCDLYIAVEAERLTAEEQDDGVVELRFIGEAGSEISLLATADRLDDLAVAIEPFLSADDASDVPASDAIQPIDAEAYDGDAELVLALVEANGVVPQKLIHEHVPVSRPNVSVALKQLAEDGAIVHERLPGRNAGKVARLPDDHEASADPDDDASEASADDPELEDLHNGPQDEFATQTDTPDGNGDLDLSQYGQTGQVVSPELLIDALEGAQTVYHVRRVLRLTDREVEDILRNIGLYEELRDGSRKLDRETADRHVRRAVA